MANSRRGLVISGGVGEALALLSKRLSTAILKYPSGRFGLVGSIPGELTELDPKALSPGQRKSMVWDTEQDVIDALLAIGVTDFQLTDCSRYQPVAVASQPAPDAATVGMSDKEVHDYFKRTAPVEDVKFWLRLNLPTPVHDACVELLQALDARKGKPTTDTKAAYRRIQQMYRESTVVYTGTAADGDKGWNVYYRNAKGKLFEQKGKKMVEVTSTRCSAIIRPMPAKIQRAKVALETSPKTADRPAIVASTNAKTCNACATEQPIDQYTYGDGGRTVRNKCRTCHRQQQRDTAARRKQAA